jgi:hypothetical protein
MTAVVPLVAIPFREFLETVPSLERRLVTVQLGRYSGGARYIKAPSIYRYCPGNDCLGERFFDWKGQVDYPSETNVANERFLSYECRNCDKGRKTFALRFWRPGADQNDFLMIKIGEIPRFGEPRPDVVTDVLDDEIKFFEYGYRAERDGLGIGAFAYYRRFVESHKDKIIAEIKKVAIAQNLDKSIIETLDRAATKREFKAAVDEIKDAIPDSLKINGANPLTLLHNALSGGLHNDDDVDCLEIAQDIRTVLTALASRTSELLKAETGFKDAVTRLNKRNSGQKPPSP